MKYNMIKMLAEKRILDSYQFIESCQFKLSSAQISIQAMKNITKEQFDNFDKERKALSEEALKNGKATIKATSDVTNYLGDNIGRTIIIDKLIIEIFSILHNFFDNFAQCINTSFYANKGKHIKRVSFPNIVGMIDGFPEYSGDLIAKVKNAKNAHEYNFICDFNNIVKHRHQIRIKGKFNMLNSNKSLLISKFNKENNYYDEKEALEIIDECFNFCYNLFNEYVDYLEKYYKTNNNNYVENRLYNPKTELVFDNKEDFEKRNVKSCIHYIELDKNNLQNDYRVLLVYPNDNIEKYQMYNSPYTFIAIKDIMTQKYVAYLIPEDDDTYELNDERLIEYRKYKLIKNNHMREILKKGMDGDIKHLLLLSETTICIVNPDE